MRQSCALNIPRLSVLTSALYGRQKSPLWERKTDSEKVKSQIIYFRLSCCPHDFSHYDLPCHAVFWAEDSLVTGTFLEKVYKGRNKLYPVAAPSSARSSSVAPRRPGISPKTTGEYNMSKPSFTPMPVRSPLPGSTPEQRFPTLDAGRDSVPQREGQYVLVIILIPAFIHPTPIYWAPPVDYVLGWASRICKSIKQSSCHQWAHRQGRAKPWW